jgi:superfamily I DNA and/or RNA helicase
MGQTINVENKKLILDFGYLQNVIFKDDLKRLDNIIEKLNILSVHNYMDLINFFRGSSVDKGYICLINSNTRKGKKNSENFLDAVLRIKLNDSSQAWLEPGTYLGFYIDINLENPTLKIKNIFITQMAPEPQPFETEFGECQIEIVRFEKQIKPEQVIRECVINPYNVRQIKPLSNKFEIEKAKWSNYLSFFGWFLKLRQSNSELFLNLGHKKMIRVEKNDIRSEATKKLASLLYNDSQFAYFDLDIFTKVSEILKYKEVNVGFVDLLVDKSKDNHENLKKQLEIFVTPITANKNIENVHGDKEALIDFSYSKKTDVNIFNLILNWIGDAEEEVSLYDYVVNTKTAFINYFQKKELQSFIKAHQNLVVKKCFVELNNDITESDLAKLNLGYVAFIGAGEDALLDRMREVLKKVSTGQSKNPYLINYLFNTDLISFNNDDIKIDESINYFNNLNDEQKLAVNKALNTKDIFILQGPPGTGKTQVISEIVSQFAKRGQKVLISSQSNDAIQNVLERIPTDVNINSVRFINKSYNKQENLFGIDDIVFNHYKLLDQEITSNVDFDDSRLTKFYQLRRQLENLILNSQGMHETRNNIRVLKKENAKLESEIAKAKDDKLNISKIRVENDNEKFQANNLINALNDMVFDVTVENTRLITRVFDRDISNDFFTLVMKLNYTFSSTSNVCSMFDEIFAYIKTRDENFNKYESILSNLNLLSKNEKENGKEINLLKHEMEYLMNEIYKNEFYREFDGITKLYVAKLENELYNYEFELIETGNEEFIDNKIKEANVKINANEVKINSLMKKLSVIDSELDVEIKKLNKEFKFDLSLLDPDMENIAKVKLNSIEDNLKNKKRRKEFIGPLINDINKYYKNNYQSKDNDGRMSYDAKKYHATVFDNLVNVFALTLTSPDKFRTNPRSKMFEYGIEEVSLKFVDVDVVVVDEASKANLLELFMALMYGKTLILVGDYRQLPPIINIHNDNVEMVNQKYKKNFYYDSIVKLLEDSPFKNLIASNNKGMTSTLKLQYRSHRDIVNVMNYFYGQELKSHPDVDTTKKHFISIKNKSRKLIDDRSAAYWVDSSKDQNEELYFEKSEGYSNSLYNELEIKIIMNLLKKINADIKLKNLKEKPTVAIINFYSLQMKKMKKEFEKISTQIDALNVTIDTVDAFQGREADYVFVSLVRNPKSLNNEVGREFLKRYERINVAFSRARKLLVIVGARRSVSELMVDLPDYNNPNIINSRAVYDDIFSMLWNKNATLTTKDILEE